MTYDHERTEAHIERDRSDFGPDRPDPREYEEHEREEHDPDGDVIPVCYQCGGLVMLLGRLGLMTHWRCIYCGWDTAIAYADLDPEVQESVDEVEG